MVLDRTNNDVFLDLSLSLGPTRRPSTPSLPSVQPVTGDHRQHFMQLLMSSPPLPPSPAAAGPPQLSLSVPPVNLHQSAPQPIMGLVDHSFIGSWNVAAAVAQPWSVGPPPLVAPSLDLPPHPVANVPSHQAVSVPRNTRGPGRPAAAGEPHQIRRRSSAISGEAEEGVEEEIPAPYPWATTRPAKVHAMRDLVSNGINLISGQVQCKRCEKVVTIHYNLREKFVEIFRYIVENKERLRDRAPSQWMSPRLPPCETCESGMKPVMREKKEEINWLFLLLGQMLGCCTLEQLRYFCDKSKIHRTGAKDRVLYLTYLALCKQLDPSGPFDR
ncbi:PREDICTED: uncharacterized protein LOC104804357 [Tarenaya hassleriana]|uniref:uncharacterized protein LOC104804357 n=1 Tax=Tarenaya hassleriana TaxID=28532 RepID=UPI00053C9748|nr:PREDICTED: uncharacterized protein LOC104804357 [Tarenaya hassleriana]